MGRMVTLQAADGHALEAWRAEPAATPRGGVVIIQEAFGVNEHIRAVCDDYAARGYVALAPALYDRQQRAAAFGYDDASMNRGLALRRGIDWDKVPVDVDAAIEALRPLRVGIVGFLRRRLGGLARGMPARDRCGGLLLRVRISPGSCTSSRAVR